MENENVPDLREHEQDGDQEIFVQEGDHHEKFHGGHYARQVVAVIVEEEKGVVEK